MNVFESNQSSEVVQSSVGGLSLVLKVTLLSVCACVRVRACVHVRARVCALGC